MKLLAQRLKSGDMQVIETPLPVLGPRMLMVKNYYSVISAGTEGSTVKAARKGYIGKAKERPEQVRQVIDTLKRHGPVQAYRAVMKKLDAYSPLGYSCVGEVVEIGRDTRDFGVGDIVACGGATASHAEVIAVPEQLCVRVAPGSKQGGETHWMMAAYNTLGAIAMQGVRQADIRIGETCAVIGLGLLGQLTAAILKASGAKVVGIDIDPGMVGFGGKHYVDLALVSGDSGIGSRISEFTGGIGCDAVIIAAATDSLDPINLAGAISRKRATIVVVGAVPTGFEREPHFYRKELTLKMSCSCGPGRYDPAYEEKGHDYPVGYVRWTEKRNMQAFQDLIASGRMDISCLTTHVFDLEDSHRAYDMIVGRDEPFLGILLRYDREKEVYREKVVLRRAVPSGGRPKAVNIGFIGAGSYAQSYLLPNIPKRADVVLKGVMTSSAAGCRSVADRFGFEFCTSLEDDIVRDPEINTVFIATRHDSHAYYVKKALDAGKSVFVEKPLCLTMEELTEIREAYNKISEKGGGAQPLLMVGYNRRFAPLTEILMDRIGARTMSMVYRVNAGSAPAESWIQDADLGGGRIIGEACHFIDYLAFVNGSAPVSVYASGMKDPHALNDTVNINVTFENGSIGVISYFANGSRAVPKEYVEIHAGGITAILTDFKQLAIYEREKVVKKRLITQDKGQKRAIEEFLGGIRETGTSPVSFEDVYRASLATFKAVESLKTFRALRIESQGQGHEKGWL